VTTGPTESARLPPPRLPGLDPAWSRLVKVPSGTSSHTFHVLDTMPSGDADLTVLCVHGNPSWSYLWRQLLAELPDGVRGIAIDHLDMGFSERTGTARRLGQRIDDLCDLTKTLALEGPVVTVAHDWGGPISLGWAQRNLQMLKGVVLTNTAVHQPEGAQAPRVIRAARTRGALHRATVDTTAFITGAFQMSHPRTPKPIREGFLAPYKTPERRHAIKMFVEDIPLEDEHPTRPVLDGVADGLKQLANVPTLLLWGSKDLVFSDLYLHDLEARLPHAAVHRWAHAGHFVTEDAPVATAVVDWIGSLDEASEADLHDAPESSQLFEHMDRPELVDTTAVREMTGRSITFGELTLRVEAAAAGLASIGVASGDRVAVMIPPGVDLATAVYACWRRGAVAVLVDGALSPKQMGAALNAAYPAHLIGIPKALAAARALRWPGQRISAVPLTPLRQRLFGAEHDLESITAGPATATDAALPDADTEAAVVFTSGSTGPSKGVRYTHRQIAAQRDALMELYDITSADRLVAAFAPFALYGPAMGITSVVPDMDVSAPASIDSTTLAQAVDAVEATIVFASPAALESLVRTEGEIEDRYREALGRVRVLLSAGAPVRASLLRSAQVVFPNAVAHTPYGMTEVLPVASISLPELDEVGDGAGVCVGNPAAGVDVSIRPLGAEALDRVEPGYTDSPNVFGEVVVRAPHARLAYDRLWHTTYLASQPLGWHATGDVGHLDHEGKLWIAGRVTHLVWTESGPIGPVGLEKSVESLDGIYAAAVVGVGPVGVQQVVVVVEREHPKKRAALAPLELIDEVRALSEIDVVAVFEVPDLPVDRRHNSKIDRTRVAEWAEVALGGGTLGSL
jgi:acyl-coenzyme A synthetase/AMP-(fatty) acid ligase/pimeloyl-ACP methyl ester carboxylesterase